MQSKFSELELLRELLWLLELLRELLELLSELLWLLELLRELAELAELTLELVLICSVLESDDWLDADDAGDAEDADDWLESLRLDSLLVELVSST